MSKREDILTAIETALKAEGKPASLNVHRSTTEMIDSEMLPIAVISPVSEKSKITILDELLVESEMIVRVYIGVLGEPFDKKLDQHVTWARKALLTDSPLQLLIHDITPVGIEWAVEERDEVYGVANMDFVVEYDEVIS